MSEAPNSADALAPDFRETIVETKVRAEAAFQAHLDEIGRLRAELARRDQMAAAASGAVEAASALLHRYDEVNGAP